jgi:hypothetical protein
MCLISFCRRIWMDKLTAIKGALCIIAAFVSTAASGDQLGPNANDKPVEGIQLSRGELGNVPPHMTAPGISDAFDPPSESALPAVKLDEVRPSKFKLEISLTMRRLHVAGRRHRAHRSCR